MLQKTGIISIDGYLAEMGWSHQHLADNVIKTSYEGHFGATNVLVQMHGQRIRLAISPIVMRPAHGWGQSVESLIATLGERDQLVKVGLDRDGDVYAKADLGTDTPSFEQFVYVILSLCKTAEQMMVPVLQAHAFDTYAQTQDQKALAKNEAN